MRGRAGAPEPQRANQRRPSVRLCGRGGGARVAFSPALRAPAGPQRGLPGPSARTYVRAQGACGRPRGERQPWHVQSARAGVRGPGAPRRGGATHTGRTLCALP